MREKRAIIIFGAIIGIISVALVYFGNPANYDKIPDHSISMQDLK